MSTLWKHHASAIITCAQNHVSTSSYQNCSNELDSNCSDQACEGMRHDTSMSMIACIMHQCYHASHAHRIASISIIHTSSLPKPKISNKPMKSPASDLELYMCCHMCRVHDRTMDIHVTCEQPTALVNTAMKHMCTYRSFNELLTCMRSQSKRREKMTLASASRDSDACDEESGIRIVS